MLAGEQRRVLFFYWGRRGAMCRFTLDLARAATTIPGLEPTISVSDSNELYRDFRELGDMVLPVRTFDHGMGALRLDRLLGVRVMLEREVRRRHIDTVVSLMPHIWSPIVGANLRQTDCQYVLVVHDALGHPGDRTAWLNGWLMRDVSNADLIVTLSEAVAGRLSASGEVQWGKILPLFHPDLDYGLSLSPAFPRDGEPFRVLLFGRLLQYKGLPMFLDAVDILRSQGMAIELGVYGEGDIRRVGPRLKEMGTEVRNTWIPDGEVRGVFGRYHAVVLAHTEASQSGIVAAAHGLGMPVIVTPVGGLPEQVAHGTTGLIADHADPPALARAIARLATSPTLFQTICRGIAEGTEQRSMRRFVVELMKHACYVPSGDSAGMRPR